MHRRAFSAAVLALLLAACGSVDGAQSRGGQGRTEPLQVVTQAGKTLPFQVEVVATEASRERGLMYRTSLPANAGMLFDFKSSREVAFWMKNTFIPLDIIFIDESGRIVNIAAQATPLSEEPLPSAGPVLGVLEINGGRAEQLGIHAGDMVRHPMFARR